MKKLYILLLLLTGIGLFAAHAQSGTSSAKADSLLKLKLRNQLNKVQQLSAERLADSLRRADLELRVAGLTTADRLKKAELLKELTTLKERDSLQRIKQKRQVDSLRKFVKGFAVAPFSDTLFYIYTRQGSFTAQERAAAISKRINLLSKNYSFKADSLKIIPSEQTVDLVFKNNLLISVSEQDALWQNTTKPKLAAKLKTVIVTAITQYRNDTSWQTLLKEVLLAALVIMTFMLVIYTVNKVFKWAHAKLAHQKAWYSSGIHIRDYELLNSGQQLTILHFIIKIIKWIILIVVIYFTLLILFGIFPFTRSISDTLLTYIVSPIRKIALAIWNYIPNLITIIIIVVVFRYVLLFLGYIKKEIEQEHLKIPGFYADWANPTYQIIRILILAFMLIVIFPYMPGSDSQIFKGVSVFIGVLFTFGSAGALGNVVAGLVLTYMRAFTLGDRVKIGDVTGDIIGKTLLVTRIRTIQNEIISIPNSTVLNSHTLNYSSEAQERGLILNTTVTIGYDAPWRQVHQLLIAAAMDTPMIEKEPEPYVLQTALDDYYVCYRINAYTKEPNKQAVIYSNLYQNIQDHFNKAGVEIMSPHYKALRDGNATTIPPVYLPKDYVAPAFNTKQQDSGKKDK